MNYPLIQAYMNDTVWLCKQEIAIKMFDIVGRMFHSGKPLSFESAPYGQQKVDKSKANEQGIGIAELHGPIFNRGNMMVDVSGSVSPQSYAANMISMADNKDIAEIIMSVDSGGGEATNIDEAAEAVRYAVSKKPVTTVANGLMASAAYWIGSQSSKVLATKGSILGSIGAVMAHSDFTKANEEEGVDVKIYRTGENKMLGGDVDPNDEHMSEQMGRVLTDVLDLFVTDVASARGMDKQYVLDKFALDGEGSLAGGTVYGAEALELGLIDGISTFQGAVNDSVSRVAQAHSKKRTYLVDKKIPSMSTKKVGNMEDILASLGLNDGSTDEDVLAAIAERTSTKVTNERTKLLAKLSLDADSSDDRVDQHIKTLNALAEDGKQYREDSLDQIHALTIATESNGPEGQEAADRMRQVYSVSSIDNIRAEVTRLQAKRDGMVPDGRQSKDSPDDAPKEVKPDFDAV